MAFEPEKITKAHILNAVDIIERERRVLRPSTGYDVVINGRKYPPKEVIRIAHELATGQGPGIIYGGEQVNKHFKRFGFEIVEKVQVWKLGCYWNTGTPSFYEFIKERNIVFGVDKALYKDGDLILIAEGFTVYAIAKVLEAPKPVTIENDFSTQLGYYSIPFEDDITFAKAEWYELPKTEVFIYQLQSGIRQVRKQDIRNRAINLWGNKDTPRTDLPFYTKGFHEAADKGWNYPCLVLIHNSWNDYGFVTSFDVTYYKSEEEKVEIGITKILEANNNITRLPSSFESLPNNYCSLGQTLKYYTRLYDQLPEAFFRILKSLNDCAFYDEHKEKFIKEEGFQTSLLRSSEASLALNEAKIIISNQLQDKQYRFDFEYKLDSALEPHCVEFEFYRDIDLRNRFYCIIGKNGTGKTKVISQLANKLTDNEEDGVFKPERPNFSKVIASSFSYFDKFKFPRPKDISYEFIGIKDEKGLINEKRINQILWNSFKVIANDREKRQIWRDSIKSALEADYLNFNIDELDALSTKKSFIDKSEDIFSSGQKVVFQFITRLIASIEFNSLIIFDEPETHLHPNIAGKLLRAINTILNSYRSFCILATHSPVIIQEVPARYVRIFDRQGDVPIIFKPVIETLGENLSIINNSIFHVDKDKELYKSLLEELSKRMSMEEIEQLFDYKLSLNETLYIQSIKND